MILDIIANPTSGPRGSEKVLKAIETYLYTRNIDYHVHITQHKWHAKELAQNISKYGKKTVVAVGGDGTFSECLNGMNFESSRLGFVCAGRGNDFAATMGLSHDPITAISAIAMGNPCDYDYIQVGKNRCINVCGTGLDIEVLKAVEGTHNSISYTVSLCKCLLKFKPYHVTVQVQTDKSEQYDCIMAAVCNGKQYGGGMNICPVASITDGKLDLIIVEKPKNIPTLLLVPQFVKGKLFGKPYYHHIKATSVKVISQGKIQLDGEIFNDNILNAKIVPRGIKSFATHP